MYFNVQFYQIPHPAPPPQKKKKSAERLLIIQICLKSAYMLH